MTHQEILEKAIQKAIENGWEQPSNLTFTSHTEFIVYLESISAMPYDLRWLRLKVNELLYDHDFAKALWGDWHMVETGRVYNADGSLYADNTVTAFSGKSWQYHLQQMVISDDPIQYLGEHLND